MPFQLSFTHREAYSSLASGINLETTLRFGELFINCDAKVDTGAEVCLFQRAIAEALEISYREWHSEEIRNAHRSFDSIWPRGRFGSAGTAATNGCLLR